MRLINVITAERGIYIVPEAHQDKRNARLIVLAWLHVEEDGKDYVLPAIEDDMCTLATFPIDVVATDIRKRMTNDEYVVVTGASATR